MSGCGSIEKPSRGAIGRSALALACAVLCLCGCSPKYHLSYFDKMVANMPARGQLRMHSQFYGLSASYVGPGLESDHDTVQLASAYYAHDRLILSFDHPVSVHGDVDLATVAEFKKDGRVVSVSNIFTGTPILLKTPGYVLAIAVTASLKDPNGAVAEYTLRLRQRVIDTQAAHDDYGPVSLWIP